jgi:hypothetical protein
LLSRVADLHQELAVIGEFQALIVILPNPCVTAVAADPDIAFGVHGNAMLLHRPIEFGALALAHRQHAAPTLDETSVGGDLHNRGRRSAAHVIWRIAHGEPQAPGAGIDPDIVVRIHSHAATRPKDIAMRQWLPWPIGVDLENRMKRRREGCRDKSHNRNHKSQCQSREFHPCPRP